MHSEQQNNRCFSLKTKKQKHVYNFRPDPTRGSTRPADIHVSVCMNNWSRMVKWECSGQELNLFALWRLWRKRSCWAVSAKVSKSWQCEVTLRLALYSSIGISAASLCLVSAPISSRPRLLLSLFLTPIPSVFVKLHVTGWSSWLIVVDIVACVKVPRRPQRHLFAVDPVAAVRIKYRSSFVQIRIA